MGQLLFYVGPPAFGYIIPCPCISKVGNIGALVSKISKYGVHVAMSVVFGGLVLAMLS